MTSVKNFSPRSSSQKGPSYGGVKSGLYESRRTKTKSHVDRDFGTEVMFFEWRDICWG